MYVNHKPYIRKGENQEAINKRNLEYPGRPINVCSASNNKQYLRNWHFEHLTEWIQIEDPSSILKEYTNPETQSFPPFKEDSLNVKYIVN